MSESSRTDSRTKGCHTTFLVESRGDPPIGLMAILIVSSISRERGRVAVSAAASVVLVAITIGGIVASAVWLLPALGRVRFEAKISAIRDEVFDAMIRGKLPDDECVTDFIRRADSLQQNSRHVSLSFMLSARASLRRFGRLPEFEQPTFAELDPEAHRYMHEREAEVVDAVRIRLVRGSLALLPLMVLRPFVRKLAETAPEAAPPGPKVLASEWRAASVMPKDEGRRPQMA